MGVGALGAEGADDMTDNRMDPDLVGEYLDLVIDLEDGDHDPDIIMIPTELLGSYLFG